MALGQLADLPDDATLQLIAAEPPLTPSAVASLAEAIDRLFRQFAREDRVRDWAIESVAGGALVAVAWHGAGDLSGCSKDKLAQVLADRERRDGVALLAAPPLVVGLAEGPRAVDRATLRRLIGEGAVGPGTLIHDRRIQRLGTWRSRGRIPLAESWLADLLRH